MKNKYILLSPVSYITITNHWLLLYSSISLFKCLLLLSPAVRSMGRTFTVRSRVASDISPSTSSTGTSSGGTPVSVSKTFPQYPEHTAWKMNRGFLDSWWVFGRENKPHFTGFTVFTAAKAARQRLYTFTKQQKHSVVQQIHTVTTELF